MKVLIRSSEEIAQLAAQQYAELLAKKPDAVLGFATGSTPLALYTELARQNSAGKISFRDATTFNLDEYAGLDGTHDQSYRHFMNANLLEKIDIPLERTFVPSGFCKTNEQAAEYDRKIETAGGIDMQLLGIGQNGHIGFNEPGTPFGSRTHRVALTESTRRANARFFASIDMVPTHAVTMGMRTVMNARSIIMIALGASKAPVVKEMLCGPVTERVPASVLQLHPSVTVYLDQEAANLL